MLIEINLKKKPLITNTTKILKAKKIKISKNKFNPKNVLRTFKNSIPPRTTLLKTTYLNK